ncbi:GDSL-type esterase/lipase family protein [Piscinibacter sakaiensis]|uniref:GDSL-type esterase/lipase family protein n=1 Tax=Piscinibacter sakaiensis TaxID=1547922 RepID=UPI0006B47061|nr:GDSL-type esterase/lipase family protein [Piscinibacter sakaiensis]
MPPPPRGDRAWRTAFLAPLQGPIRGNPQADDAALRFADLSLRQFLPLALPGGRLRVRLANPEGDAPLQVGAASVGWRRGRSGAGVQPGSLRPLSFDGARTVQVPPGATRFSDPVALPPPAPGGVAAEPADLALSLFLPQRSPRASWHPVGGRSSHRSLAGDHVDAPDFPEPPAAPPDRALYFVDRVEVEAPAAARLWVAFGDSITDGAWHRVDTDGSWPAQWNHRWRRAPGAAARPPLAVLNAGLGGNRLLSAGESAPGRLRYRDEVLALPGAVGVAIQIGINDLGQAAPAQLPAVAQALRDGWIALAREAREAGLRAVGVTLLPVGGSFYDRPEVEAARRRHNDWLRRSRVVDAVIDADRLLRDPRRPAALRAAWTEDHLHPNDAGYARLAALTVQVLARAGLEPPRR